MDKQKKKHLIKYGFKEVDMSLYGLRHKQIIVYLYKYIFIQLYKYTNP